MFDFVTPPRRHPNTLRFCARDAQGEALLDEAWCSVGGGFIVREDEAEETGGDEVAYPYPFRSSADLLARGRESGLTIARSDARQRGGVARAAEVAAHVDLVIATMLACVDRGLARRRAIAGRPQGPAPRQGDLRPPARQCDAERPRRP